MSLFAAYPKKLFILSLIAMTGLFVSCASDNEEDKKTDPEPASGCKTVYKDVKYASVDSVLRANCYRCHSGASPANGYDLSNYNVVKSLVGTSANYGVLYRSINHMSGTLPMPTSGKLSDCDLAKIKTWIDEGAKNN